MKTLMFYFVLFSFFSLTLFSQKFVSTTAMPTVNNWYCLGVFVKSFVDSSTKSQLLFKKQNNSHTQAFYSGGDGYGSYFWGYYTKAIWYKEYGGFLIPDSIAIDSRYTGGNAKGIKMYITIQDFYQSFYALEEWGEVPKNGEWKTLYWDLSKVKNFGINSMYRIGLSFEIEGFDTTLIKGGVEVDNLRGIDTLGSFLVDGFGDSVYSVITDVSKTRTNPKGFVLYQNYPNPFNPTTIIKFSVFEREQVSLKIFDLLGQEVKTLVQEEKTKGSYEVVFNASELPSGIYVYQLKTGKLVETKKMVLMK